MHIRSLFCLLAALLICCVSSLTVRAADSESPVFEDDVLPVFAQKCASCHGAKARKGDLDLSSFSALKDGGESGEELLAESLDDSLLWQMLDGGGMPPEDSPQLTDEELDAIRRWIEAGGPAREKAAEQVVTQHDILPYLYTRCVVCHGKRRQEAELDLRSVASILQGGKSGPAVVPGKPEASLILKRIHSKDMPPPKELIRAGVRPFESNETELLTKWIAQGAKEYDIAVDAQTGEPDPLVSDDDRSFWSFQSPRKPAVPKIDAASADIRPVDAFLLRKLRDKQLGFSDEASRLTLIRRVAFDLTGLPPKWNDVERFLADKSPNWYAKLVDHYLESPHYGERWGRYWLDLCGYADSEGKRSADPIRPHAWRYRDYVIRSFNDDKPYNRFLLEQVAGDELFDFENADAVTPEMMDALVATGFLRMAPDGTGSDIVDTVAERFEVVADEIEILGTAVLGLTLKCAQCHTHKYDPIPQRDYYRLVAVFQGAYDVYDWLKPTSVPGQSKQANPTRRYLSYVSANVKAEYEAARRPIQQQIDAAKKKLADLTAKLRAEHFDAKLAELTEELRDDVKAAFDAKEADRSEVQKYLVEKFQKRLTISDANLQKQNKELAALKKDTDKQVKDQTAKLPPEPMIRALWDRGEPSPTWLFRRGEFTNPGDPIGPGVLSVLTDGKTSFEPKAKRGGSTGRRLAFAEWLTRPDHPLTSRVLVNRVWFHHFGRGIVESLSNFGKTGVPPTHPELLDWLATSFVENGWSIKWLHRELLNSQAYRQSSQFRDESQSLDPDNRWLSRMPLHRLEAESVRDSLLAVSSQLDESRFGSPDTVTVRNDGLITSKRTDAGWRRTVYVRQRRKEIPTILETFDLPQMIPNCIQRPNSTVASQALHLLNNGMVRDIADDYADAITKEIPDDRYRQIGRVYQTALSRDPGPEEMQLALETLEKLTTQWETQLASAAAADSKKAAGGERSAETRALANFCHIILNSAEFLFVD
ncbi:MAG: DUF1553 domain-containing protein [Planctomycetota bacterium]|jgi:mono/diheme cytochrome c family protein